MISEDLIQNLCAQFTSLEIKSGRSLARKIFIVPKSIQRTNTTTFWQTVQKIISTNQNIIEFQFEQGPRFSADTIRSLLQYKVAVAPAQLTAYIRKLNEANIDLGNSKDQGFTNLHIAAITNRTDLITWATEKNETNILDTQGRTPLHLCVHFDHQLVAKMLLQFGADAHLATRRYSAPICLALLNNQHDMVNVLAQPINFKVSLLCTDFQNQLLDGKITANQEASKTADIATALFMIKHQRKKDHKVAFERILNLTHDPLLAKGYYKEETVRRLVYHLWKIDWNAGQNSLTIPQRLLSTAAHTPIAFSPVYGGHQPFFLHTMQKATLEFMNLLSPNQTLDRQALIMLNLALHVAANSCEYSSRDLLARVQCGNPVILSVDFPNHTVTVMLWKHYFFLCNKGIASRKPVEVFTFQKNALTTETIDRIRTTFDSEQAYTDFFCTKLPKTLQFGQRAIEQNLELLLQTPMQTIGNCAWESPETCVYAFMLFNGLWQKHLVLPDNFFPVRYNPVLSERKLLFQNWLLFCQLKVLRKYLSVLHSPNRLTLSNYELLAPAKQAYQSKKTAPWILPALKETMTALDREFEIDS